MQRQLVDVEERLGGSSVGPGCNQFMAGDSALEFGLRRSSSRTPPEGLVGEIKSGALGLLTFCP
jgi:hypothetical protein